MNGPLHLTEIRTRGPSHGTLSAIQFVFSNGVESPFFGAGAGAERSESTSDTGRVSIPDMPIKRVSGLTNVSFGCMYSLHFEPEENPVEIYGKGRSDTGVEESIDIPDNHSIIGLFGKMFNGARVDYLGFIVSGNDPV